MRGARYLAIVIFMAFTHAVEQPTVELLPTDRELSEVLDMILEDNSLSETTDRILEENRVDTPGRSVNEASLLTLMDPSHSIPETQLDGDTSTSLDAPDYVARWLSLKSRADSMLTVQTSQGEVDEQKLASIRREMDQLRQLYHTLDDVQCRRQRDSPERSAGMTFKSTFKSLFCGYIAEFIDDLDMRIGQEQRWQYREIEVGILQLVRRTEELAELRRTMQQRRSEVTELMRMLLTTPRGTQSEETVRMRMARLTELQEWFSTQSRDCGHEIATCLQQHADERGILLLGQRVRLVSPDTDAGALAWDPFLEGATGVFIGRRLGFTKHFVGGDYIVLLDVALPGGKMVAVERSCLSSVGLPRSNSADGHQLTDQLGQILELYSGNVVEDSHDNQPRLYAH